MTVAVRRSWVRKASWAAFGVFLLKGLSWMLLAWWMLR